MVVQAPIARVAQGCAGRGAPELLSPNQVLFPARGCLRADSLQIILSKPALSLVETSDLLAHAPERNRPERAIREGFKLVQVR